MNKGTARAIVQNQERLQKGGFQTTDEAQDFINSRKSVGKLPFWKLKQEVITGELGKIIENQNKLDENRSQSSSAGVNDVTSMRGLLGDYSVGEFEDTFGTNGEETLGVMDIWRRKIRGL